MALTELARILARAISQHMITGDMPTWWNQRDEVGMLWLQRMVFCEYSVVDTESVKSAVDIYFAADVILVPPWVNAYTKAEKLLGVLHRYHQFSRSLFVALYQILMPFVLVAALHRGVSAVTKGSLPIFTIELCSDDYFSVTNSYFSKEFVVPPVDSLVCFPISVRFATASTYTQRNQSQQSLGIAYICLLFTQYRNSLAIETLYPLVYFSLPYSLNKISVPLWSEKGVDSLLYHVLDGMASTLASLYTGKSEVHSAVQHIFWIEAAIAIVETGTLVALSTATTQLFLQFTEDQQHRF